MLGLVEEKDGLLSFDDVQERLVQAMLTCWRLPDRERGMLRVRALWPDLKREQMEGDHGEGGVEGAVQLRPVALTRRDYAEMEEAFGWMDGVEGDDRKLIGLAIVELAKGAARIPWRRLLPKMGLSLGAYGLAARYSKAMGALTKRINRNGSSQLRS